jgi:hypothetical protein
MKTGAIRAAAFVMLALSCAACGADVRIGRYVKYDAGEFVIVTSRSANQARQFIENLAMFRATLERTLGKPAFNRTTPTTIVIASNSDWHAWLEPRENAGGFFLGGRFSNFLAMNGDYPFELSRVVVYHEYTHYYLASQFAAQYPPWFNEGMAELMGYASFDKGRAVMRIPTYRRYEARDSDWIPFERLIRVEHDDPEYQSHKLGPSFYAQSWLTVHYGMVENRDFGRQMLEYVGQLNKLVPQEQAAANTFGKDLAAVDQQLREYSRSTSMSSGFINLGDLPPVIMAEGKPLDESDSLEILADVMIEVRMPEARIRPLVEALQRREPGAARPAILAARLAQLADDNAAFDKAITQAEAALKPTDTRQRRELAKVLLASSNNTGPVTTRKTEDIDRDTRRSLKLFAEVIQADNTDVEALWGFGTSATRLDRNPDLAEQALLAAYQRAPANGTIAVSLAQLMGRQDRPEEMVRYLRDAQRYTSDLGTRRWATETLSQTEQYLDQVKQAEAENQKRQAEYEKQLAEYEKKYGKPKKK